MKLSFISMMFNGIKKVKKKHRTPAKHMVDCQYYHQEESNHMDLGRGGDGTPKSKD